MEEALQQDNEIALKNSLLDIECLNPLKEWTNKVNMFEILKISRAEIRHSNMLSWLLDNVPKQPMASHGVSVLSSLGKTGKDQL